MNRLCVLTLATGLISAALGGQPLGADQDTSLPTKIDTAAIDAHLARCFPTLGLIAPKHHDVTAAVTLAPEGTKIGALRMVTPHPSLASVPQLRQFLRVEVALHACPPLPVPGASPVTLHIATNGDALTAHLPDSAELARLSAPNDAANRATETLVAATPSPQVQAPSAPPALAVDEQILALGRSKRREIQIRLRLAGFDPGGADGRFGARARESIMAWQAAAAFPPTGFLNATQMEKLIATTAEAYATRALERSSNRSQRNDFAPSSPCPANPTSCASAPANRPGR